MFHYLKMFRFQILKIVQFLKISNFELSGFLKNIKKFD
jgi:hypothetical protein